MLRILGSPKTLCDRTTRRDLLRVGGLSLFGLGLGDLLRLEANANADSAGPAPGSFGKAKSCILLYLYGAPSQLETVDPKPEAPVEIRGELNSIPSSLPGLDVCELLPNMAKMMDRTTVVRSVTHPYPLHGVAFALTGVPAIDVPMELNPYDVRHWPFFGSVVQYLDERDPQRSGRPNLPHNLVLPFEFSSHRVGEVARAGPYGAFLGSTYNPVWAEFVGEGTRGVVRTLREDRTEFLDPYLGLAPESHFRLSTATQLRADMTLDRLNRRRSLLEQFDSARRELQTTSSATALDRYQEMAFSLIASQSVGEALDVRKESAATRESYGMTLFGQACLGARRMVEAGSRLVTVFWDEYGLAGTGWDTHWDHYPRMKDELLPGLDKAFSGLVLDLEQRGLLDETLVVCLSEHGRTPKLNSAQGGGRDHWSRVYSALFAGGGIARGNVVGASDRHASDPKSRPVSPKDLLATMYHLMGIDPHTTVPDRTGRQLPLVPGGAVVPEMLA